jgi:hypothetical protein
MDFTSEDEQQSIDRYVEDLVTGACAQAQAEAERLRIDMETHSQISGDRIYACFPEVYFTVPRESPLDPRRKLRILFYLQSPPRVPIIRAYLKAVVARTEPILSIEFLVEFGRKQSPARTRAFLFARKARRVTC